MNFSCNCCKLKEEMEDNKKKLYDLINLESTSFLDNQVIQLSQKLDEFINSCIFCGRLNTAYNISLNLKDIFGTHSTFYYYGQEHLFTNLFAYITEGIKNNELIYISMQTNIYDKLIELLKNNDAAKEHIKFRSVKELIMSNTQGGLSGIKEEINSICLEDDVKKYKGIRWIGQPTYAIQTTSQEDFLNWEINLSEALKDTKVSLICIYDAYDYLNEGKFINEDVIEKSTYTHSYILKDFVLEGIQ